MFRAEGALVRVRLGDALRGQRRQFGLDKFASYYVDTV